MSCTIGEGWPLLLMHHRRYFKLPMIRIIRFDLQERDEGNEEFRFIIRLVVDVKTALNDAVETRSIEG